MKEVQQIPWIKQEEMEWVDGGVYLAIDVRSFYSIPIVVKDLENGFVEEVNKNFQRHSVTNFTHYAIITFPKEI